MPLLLNLLPLMMELENADVMFLVKSLKFPSDHFNICDYLQFCSRPTRACHNLKLKHSLCRSNLECSFYFNRIPRLWNSLPPLSIHLSLSLYDKIQATKILLGSINFNPNNVCTYHYLCPCPKCSQLPIKMSAAQGGGGGAAAGRLFFVRGRALAARRVKLDSVARPRGAGRLFFVRRTPRPQPASESGRVLAARRVVRCQPKLDRHIILLKT